MGHRKLVVKVLSAAALLAASHGALAADDLATRMSASVGQWIASQGNQALRDLREETRRELTERLRPMLAPEAAPRTEPRPIGLHARARRQISL